MDLQLWFLPNCGGIFTSHVTWREYRGVVISSSSSSFSPSSWIPEWVFPSSSSSSSSLLLNLLSHLLFLVVYNIFDCLIYFALSLILSSIIQFYDILMWYMMWCDVMWVSLMCCALARHRSYFDYLLPCILNLLTWIYLLKFHKIKSRNVGRNDFYFYYLGIFFGSIFSSSVVSMI